MRHFLAQFGPCLKWPWTKLMDVPELTDDLIELRVKGALPRMEALRRVVDDHGVTHLAAICAICKSQFAKVLPYYDFSMDQVVSVHQLVSNAIVLGTKQ